MNAEETARSFVPYSEEDIRFVGDFRPSYAAEELAKIFNHGFRDGNNGVEPPDPRSPYSDGDPTERAYRLGSGYGRIEKKHGPSPDDHVFPPVDALSFEESSRWLRFIIFSKDAYSIAIRIELLDRLAREKYEFSETVPRFVEPELFLRSALDRLVHYVLKRSRANQSDFKWAFSRFPRPRKRIFTG